jgi:putative endopeptidase
VNSIQSAYFYSFFCSGISPFFSVGVSPDAKDSNHSICQIYQGGLGLPDRDYYFDEDKQDKRDAYVKHIATLLKLSNAESDDDNCSTMAKQIFDLETTLANSHMTKTECRDPEATYNKMTVAEITRRTDNNFDFASYFMGSTNKTTTDLGDVNVRNVDALTCAARVMSTLDVKVLEGYLQWTALSSCAPYLSRAFVDAQFEFFEKTLSGTDEIKPRWKRAMAFTETALGEILGELYCAKYFDEECKTRALAIVDQVRNALEQRLTTVDWMKSDLTRQEALKKMSNFKVKIGYPNKWIDYSALTFVKDEPFLSLVLKSRAFHHGRVVAEMNAPTDRDMWFMTPQTVNAYYHPSLNEIVFPAAILQHPFFDKNADDAVNFGAMGCVVGHEMTHGFDDKGRKFDAQGVLHDWWTADDAAEYEKRVNVMVEQANSFHVHGKAVQGKLTSGENIADLGGLRLALAALRATKDYDETNLIDGFTPVQRFFLSWAQCWRQNIGKERSLQLLTIDPHGPNEMRCNGPLSNLTDFYTAFNIPESSSMFKPAESRVDIW